MSRWLEPPLKVPDALNVLHEALLEREKSLGFVDEYGYLDYPIKKTTSAHAVRNRMMSIVSRIEYLFSCIIILPKDIGQWTTPFNPLTGYVAPVEREYIKSILAEHGIDPNCFFIFENPPKRYSEKVFYEAAYFLINDYLRFLSVFGVRNKYIMKNKYSGHDEFESVHSGNTRTIYQYYEDDSRYNIFVSGELNVINYTSTPLFAITGQWELKAPVFLYGASSEDVADMPNTLPLLAKYEQIFKFNGTVADAPSNAFDYVNKDDFTNAKNAFIQENITSEIDYFETSVLKSEDVLLKFSESNFPNYQYYDPPQ